MQCGQSYKYHYIDRLRSKFSSAALLFGSAVDRAINQLLVPKGNKSPESIFDYNWRFGEIGGKKEYLPECVKIVYAKSDFDRELLQKDDIATLLKRTNLSSQDELFEYFKKLGETKEVIGFANMSEEDRKILNYFNWLCLRRKGYLMISTYRNDIMPNIKKVHAIQKYIELENDDGDKIVGYVDLVADWQQLGNTVIFDLKTSSIQYSNDSVLVSPQLTLYVRALGDEFKTRAAGYIVLKKQVDKQRKKVCNKCGYDGSGGRHKTCSNMINGIRCEGEWNETIDPRISTQIVIDDIPERTENIVMQNYIDVNRGIKNKQFVRNFNSCEMPWGSCDFKKLCFRESMEDLTKVEEKKKKNG